MSFKEKPLLIVKNKPINFRGEPCGIGSVLNPQSADDRGALLAGGCLYAPQGAQEKIVPVEPKLAPAEKPAPKKKAASKSVDA